MFSILQLKKKAEYLSHISVILGEYVYAYFLQYECQYIPNPTQIE